MSKSFPKTDLPRSFEAKSPDDLERMLQRVEMRLGLAGVAAAYSEGITLPLRRVLQGRGDLRIRPKAIYYFLVGEAGRSHEKTIAAKNLVAAHDNGGLVRLDDEIARRGY